MDPSAGDGLLSPLAYAREDESTDDRFYLMPRKVVHIDDGAIAALGALYVAVLPAGGRLLDPHVSDQGGRRLARHERPAARAARPQLFRGGRRLRRGDPRRPVTRTRRPLVCRVGARVFGYSRREAHDPMTRLASSALERT